MKYKVICEVTFPAFETSLDITLPYNKSIYYICEMLNKIIAENLMSNYEKKEDSILINQKTGEIYDKNALLCDTNIKNGTKLAFY